jgi:Tol biopolymer transport system component
VRSAAAALLVALAVACSAPEPTRATPGIGSTATFLLANPAGIVALDDECRPLGPIATLPPQSAPATPSLHPDGRSVVFALTQLPHPRTGFGSDIYSVDLDGTRLRPLVEHEAENVFYASPRYDPTGTVLYFHRRAALMVNGQYGGNEDTIERLDLKTGRRDRLLTDAADPVLSPDGATLVYVRVVNGQIENLWTAAADGTGARPFFRTKDTFWYIQAPRFSPAGADLAFSAAGHSTARAAAGGRLAHLGVPSELYLAAADGTALRSIGQTGDDVVPAWSRDGERIAYVGSGAFFVATVATREIRTCAQGEDFFFGDLVWVR